MTTQNPEPGQGSPEGQGDEKGDLSTVQVVSSTLAAAFGVQSKENKVRDFERGKPHQFIIAGFVFTLLFLVGMIALVNVIV
ncbi:MAG: DUF2970 domain-containing protein [Halioglobus sp.]